MLCLPIMARSSNAEKIFPMRRESRIFATLYPGLVVVLTLGEFC